MKTQLLLRVTAPLVATSLLLLGVGLGAAWYLHWFQASVLTALKADASGVRAAEELEILVRETRTQLDYFLISGDRKHLDTIRSLDEETERWLDRTERWSLSPEEQALTGRARAGYQRFILNRRELEQRPPRLQAEAARRLIDGLVNEVQAPIHEFLDLNEEEMDTAITQNQLFASRLFWGLLLVGICGSGAGLATGVGFARAFHRRLVQLSVPIRDAAGQLDEVVGPITFTASADLRELENVLHKIAERVGAVIERLRQSERNAAHAEQLAAVGHLAAGMAHELRNPLTAMKILVQSAQTREDQEALPGPCMTAKDLIVMEDEITRLDELVRSFLEFALPPRLERKTVDVVPIIDATLGLVAGRASASGTLLKFVRPSEPIVATVDPAQFRQVLLNLLLNALDALGDKGTITVRLEKEPEGWLALHVADSGPGIPPSLGPRIFTPFVSGKESGLGLGLSICKRIAEDHAGEIRAANRAEGGAEFTLRLPASDDRARRNHVDLAGN